MSAVDYKRGDMLDKFKIIKELGHGGMGAVYLAEDTVLDRKVAIKVISRSLLSGNAATERRGEVEQRFIREAKVSALVNHQNIASVYDAVLDGPQWYIAMEYVDGEPLELKVLSEDTISAEAASGIAWHILDALQYAWEKHKIIHRDIKPANVMIDNDGVVKLIDLGIAKPMVKDDHTHHLTMENTSVATPSYASPEQIACTEELTYKTDVFALAVLLYETLTHKKPFVGNTPTALFVAKSEQKYQPIEELRPDLPPALIGVINDMLMPRPDDRPDFDELKQAFSAIYSGTSAIGAPAAGISSSGTPRSKSKLPIYIGIAACLLLVAIAGAFMFPSKPEIPPNGQSVEQPPPSPNPAPTSNVPKEDFTFGKKLQIDLVWVPELNGWVSRFETTAGQLKKCSSFRTRTLGSVKGIDFDGPSMPAVLVSRADALKYCNWLNQLMGVYDGYEFRLPTLEEWRTIRPSGTANASGKLANVGESSKDKRGLRGVLGNVCELTADGCVAGGSWLSEAYEFQPDRPREKMSYPDDRADHNVGFRLVLMPKGN